MVKPVSDAGMSGEGRLSAAQEMRQQVTGVNMYRDMIEHAIDGMKFQAGMFVLS